MKDLPTSVVVKRFSEGSLIDRIAGGFIYGSDKIGLSDTEKERLEHVELAFDILDRCAGNQNLAIKRLQNHPTLKCSYTQAYNLLQDAQFIFPMLSTFDFSYELFLKKQRIENCISEAYDEKDYKVIAKLEAEHMKVLEAIERVINKKKKPQTINIHLHMDMTKLGISNELFSEWHKELFEDIIPKVKRKYKGYDIEDAEFELLRTDGDSGGAE